MNESYWQLSDEDSRLREDEEKETMKTARDVCSGQADGTLPIRETAHAIWEEVNMIVDMTSA